MRDTSVDSLIRKTISARMQESPGSCADANTMAAYLESRLSPREKAEFEAHVSECASCQEVLGLALKLHTSETAVQEAAEQAGGKKLLFRFSVPMPVFWGALIACILIGAVLFRVTHESGGEVQKSQSAELRMPATQTETPVPSLPAPAPIANEDRSVLKKSAIEPQPYSNEAKGLVHTDRKAKIESGAPPAPVVAAEPAAPEEAANQKMAQASAPLLRGEESISRPPIYAAQNRIASDATLNMAPIGTDSGRTISPKDALSRMRAPGEFEAAGSRKIGDKSFYSDSGYWIDRQCVEHQAEQIIEITPEAPEYQKILVQYPELRNLRPALIYWEGKNYLLKP